MQSLDFHLPSLRLSLRQLQVFVTVARLGSTQAAGDAIGLSQSATSALERFIALARKWAQREHGRCKPRQRIPLR